MYNQIKKNDNEPKSRKKKKKKYSGQSICQINSGADLPVKKLF